MKLILLTALVSIASANTIVTVRDTFTDSTLGAIDTPGTLSLYQGALSPLCCGFLATLDSFEPQYQQVLEEMAWLTTQRNNYQTGFTDSVIFLMEGLPQDAVPGLVSSSQFNQMVQLAVDNYQAINPSQWDTPVEVVTPEPTTVMLIGLGLIVAGCKRRGKWKDGAINQ